MESPLELPAPDAVVGLQIRSWRDAGNMSALYWHYPHYHRTTPYGAIRNGDYKLIEFFEDGALELYNLVEDPAEETNLADTMPEKAAILLEELEQWRTNVEAQLPTPNPNYDPALADQ